MRNFISQDYGYEKTHDPKTTLNQLCEDVSVEISPNFKFGCGWFTLYSKDILNKIGVPDWLGHYGPEDTFLMYASEKAKSEGANITQYLIKGCYVSENDISRENPYKDKLSLNSHLKTQFRNQAESQFRSKLEAFTF